MSISRRQVLQVATLTPIVAALPNIAHAQVAPLSIGVNRNIVASWQYAVEQAKSFNLATAYLYTNGARGVFIDIVPEPAVGGHAGICFQASPDTSGTWQHLLDPNTQQTQEFWYRGVGVIFYENGQIYAEQWKVENGAPVGYVSPSPVGTYPKNTVLRVTATTNNATGQTDLAVYSLNSSGGVVALLWSTTLYAEVIGDRAGVFVIGGGNIQVQPYALFP